MDSKFLMLKILVKDHPKWER